MNLIAKLVRRALMIKQYVLKAIMQRTTPTQEQETHHSQPTKTQQNRKRKAKRLNSNQRVIQPLANIGWNPISAHATILIHGLKS